MIKFSKPGSPDIKNARIDEEWDSGRQLEIQNIEHDDGTQGIYIVLYGEDGKFRSNIIIPRADLDQYFQVLDGGEYLPPISEQIAELKIGTRFVTSDDNEFIKVGTDKYIETDEALMTNARRLVPDMGFLNAVDFDGDEGDSRQITIVEN
jgi:hypothetical protein